ncbi:unnamed protein product [Penicillium nalgiovense]|nr:unnamed protein product [Penicillium nalgiovense]
MFMGDNDSSLSETLPGYKRPSTTMPRPFHYIITTKMDQPTSPSPCDRPAKRQCRVFQDPEYESKVQIVPEQSSNGATIETEVPVRTHGSLTVEFMKLLHYNDALATPAFKLIDPY